MLAAANLVTYSLVLLGLFVLASGITILQVAANPLAAALGDPEVQPFPPDLQPDLQLARHLHRPVSRRGPVPEGDRDQAVRSDQPGGAADVARRDRPRLFLDLRVHHRACAAVHRLPPDRHRSRRRRRRRRSRGAASSRLSRDALVLALGAARRPRDLPLRRRRGGDRHADGLLPPFGFGVGPKRCAVRLPADRPHHGQ